MTKYIVLEGCDEEEISFVGFADNYVQAYAIALNRLKEAEEEIRNGSNKNTTVDNSEVIDLTMSNDSGYKVIQRLDVHTMVEETKAVISYTIVNMMYIISYDSEVQNSTTSSSISDPEQLDMFTYMKGGYKDGESN